MGVEDGKVRGLIDVSGSWKQHEIQPAAARLVMEDGNSSFISLTESKMESVCLMIGRPRYSFLVTQSSQLCLACGKAPVA
jgi:hypothetical protein